MLFMAIEQQSLGSYLLQLRTHADMSLRDVERASDGVVSNAYLWQLENEKRLEPSPRLLIALARVYQIPARLLFEKAGYIEAPAASDIEIAFRQVMTDPQFQF